MPVTAKLSSRFYEKLGEHVTNELVDWINSVDATYRTELREINEQNFARFDARLEQRLAEFDGRWERDHSPARVTRSRRALKATETSFRRTSIVETMVMLRMTATLAAF